jgi:hypothetical protein
MVLDRTESSSYRIVLVECGVEIRYYYGVSFLELTGKCRLNVYGSSARCLEALCLSLYRLRALNTYLHL